MALFKEVRSLQIIPPYLVQPLKANSSAHLAMSQMDLLARLLRDLGTGNTGFTVDNVMKVSAPVCVLPWPPHGRWAWGAVGVRSLLVERTN